MTLAPEALAALNHAAAAAMQGARLPTPMRPSEWIAQHFYLSAENSIIPGPFQPIAYQRAILDAGIGNDDVRTVTFQKSARVGYTKMLIAAFAYFVAHKRRKFLMYLPTDNDAIDTVRSEIDPAIRDCAPLRKALKADPEKRSKDNTRQAKVFDGAIAHIFGGKAARNYRRQTKDVVVYDELDAFDPDIEGEGSPVALGDKRLDGSTFGKSIRGSTPGIGGQSLIEEQIDAADLVFERYLPCPRCDHFQPLRWAQFRWDKGKPETVRRVCEQCSGAAHYHELRAMDERGEWRTEDGVSIHENTMSFRDQSGGTLTPRANIAFKIWAAYSYFTNWAAMAAEFEAANRKKTEGDNSRLKAFINLWLGETWEQPGTKVDAHWLLERRERYAAPAPDGVRAIVAGVDVQADRFEIEFVGVGVGEETWSLDYQRVYGDTSEASVYDDLDKALQRRFEMEGVGEMGLAGVGMDSGYQAELVYSFCAPRRGRGFFALKGYAGRERAWLGNQKRQFLNGQRGRFCPVVPVGVDHFKELIYARLKATTPGPGYCHFPDHYALDYFEGLTAEKLTPKFKRGFKFYEWQKIRVRNEPLDCRVYALAALRLNRGELTMQRGVASNTAVAASAPRPAPTPEADYTPGLAGDEHEFSGFLDDVDDSWL